MIMACTCSNAYQDARYGVGKRVFNRAADRGIEQSFRCTVCSREQRVDKGVKTAKMEAAPAKAAKKKK